MKNLAITIFIFLTAFHTSTTSADQVTIRHAKASSDAKETFVVDVLKLALSKSDSSDEYRFQEQKESVSEGRLSAWLEEKAIDVMWAGAKREYEEEYLTIRIPIFKGMLGHRIFLIRENDQARFDQVQTLDDLKSIPLGQGRFWGDTDVLKKANMTVVDPVKYESLFHMLEGGRFDFFPRAVHEPWAELENHQELNLAVEENLLLVYPYAMYFYVGKHNAELAKNIETGFMRAIEDGSFDDMFFNNAQIKATLEHAQLKHRKVFHLDNPNMSPETPINNAALWLKLEDLQS